MHKENLKKSVSKMNKNSKKWEESSMAFKAHVGTSLKPLVGLISPNGTNDFDP